MFPCRCKILPKGFHPPLPVTTLALRSHHAHQAHRREYAANQPSVAVQSGCASALYPTWCPTLLHGWKEPQTLWHYAQRYGSSHQLGWLRLTKRLAAQLGECWESLA